MATLANFFFKSHFVFEDTVEYRVREVLEEKLAVILNEFGVDKTSDVLDSAQAEELFDNLYIETLINPENLDAKVEAALSRVQEQLVAAKESAAIYQNNDPLDPTEAQKLLDHPIPHWVERMTLSYLEAYNGIAQKNGTTWDLTFPTGERLHNVVFTTPQESAPPTVHHLTLEDYRIRGLMMRLPRFAEGQPIPCLTVPGLAPDIQGYWSLWRIAIYTEEGNQQQMMPLFLHENGRCFLPTARHIWEQLLIGGGEICDRLIGEAATEAFTQIWSAAIVQGKSIYDRLIQKHHQQLQREQEKGEYAFAARRRAIERIGLPQVRDYRLNQLKRDEQAWQEQLKRDAEISPELVPLLLVRVEGEI